MIFFIPILVKKAKKKKKEIKMETFCIDDEITTFINLSQ